ncbi:MAG: prepilin-type N-terminal cleavage/methylation domain-containing protein [Chlamydiae bacterium]|nr:prepilin-type N-terminal cleavage/methylation domain-containing protein [Chlamydiota bacterium]MBI3267188.1 prepilin-type N-terminal cleavage/methylation domain-containing protein [Chlamydiota bacterium]
MKKRRRERPKRPRRQGLTLIELLLAASLFSVTGAILYSILSQGILLWQRSEKEQDSTNEEKIILEKVANDIRVGFVHQWVRCMGHADEIYFCALRRVKDESGVESLRLFKVDYSFLKENKSSRKKGLYLTQYPIEKNFLESPPEGKWITDIFKDLHFEYAYWDSAEKRLVTRDQWSDSKAMPAMVVLNAQVKEKKNNLVKPVVLPLGELIEPPKEEDEDEE